MIQSALHTYLFRLGRKAYIKTGLLGWLLFTAFLVCAVSAAFFGVKLLPTYNHDFTPFLKWQDALVALCCYVSLTSLVGSILIVRFLYALRAGYHKEMLMLSDSVLTVRDLSHENLSSIFWLVGTALSCFLATLAGLLPEMLLGWTLQLASPLWVVLGSVTMIILSIIGLAIALPSFSFVLIGLVGSISFCKKMGSPHIYHLTNQAALSIDGFVLTIIYPDAPESMIDLNSLNPEDQRLLLCLLRERWLGEQRIWNPELGDEIETALKAALSSASTVLV
ncbi:MAG: hypothetical protein ACR2H5_18630 [Ktedonobacteraceae bacterium]